MSEHVAHPHTLIAERPTGADPRPYRFPEVRRIPVAGGEVIGAHLPGPALVWTKLVMESGALHEPAGLDGLARITCSLLDEGSLDRDADAFGLAIESLGANWRLACGWETQEVGLDLPADRLGAGLDLIAEAVRRPAFTDADVERFLADHARSLKTSWAQPGTRAGLAFRQALFGADSRLGGLLGGTPETAARLDADAIRAFHASRMTAPGTLAVVGDLDTIDLAELGRVAFAGAGGTAPRAETTVVDTAPSTERAIVVDRPGAVQSVLRIGHTAPPRSTPDLIAIELFADVLGGSFGSRLNHLLREVKGYTYGAHASFGHGRRSGSFTVSASVHTEVTAAAITDAIAEVRRMRADGVTADELAATRAHSLGSMPIQLQTPGGIGGRLIEAIVHGLPTDHVTHEYAEILGTDLAAVNRAAATHLRPDELAVVVEGDAERIVPDLRAAGFDVVSSPL
ncbi:M16 family metallopeptidase [Embleya sp. NBC_00896]|uniref:M16 family metallopeptidase n=1 Tax=Embleya sp. NBC_00896 TaxID=2975961 RepID=UPI0038634351|nr:insulinase family protein [Embleya sp. NBC_00896]